MQPYTDEQLVAYADGELTSGEAQAITAAAQSDASLARRIARFSESRQVLAETFAQQMHEPVPQRLLDVLRDERARKVVPLRQRLRSGGSGWIPTALAASIALGIGLSLGGAWHRGATPQHVIAGLPQNSAELTRALQTLASGEMLAGESGGTRYEVVPTGSLRMPSGEYCREFESSVATQSGTERARGVGCRGAADDWDLRAVARIPTDVPTAMDNENYQPASGGDFDWAGALQGAQRLAPAEEQSLIERNWH